MGRVRRQQLEMTMTTGWTMGATTMTTVRASMGQYVGLSGTNVCACGLAAAGLQQEYRSFILPPKQLLCRRL